MRGEVIYVGVGLADSPIRKVREKRERNGAGVSPTRATLVTGEKLTKENLIGEKLTARLSHREKRSPVVVF